MKTYGNMDKFLQPIEQNLEKKIAHADALELTHYVKLKCPSFFELAMKNYGGHLVCNCLRLFNGDREVKAYKDCTNCFGYGIPPIGDTEI
jgi:hypothetical protein